VSHCSWPVIYFIGQILFVAVPVSSTGNLQRAIYLLFFIINLPAVPFRLLVPVRPLKCR